MIGTIEVKDLAITLSLEQWVNLATGDFMDSTAEGFYEGEGIQVKVGQMIFTGVIVNYAILLTHMSWGLGDPTDSRNAGTIEEFLVAYGGTAHLIYRPAGDPAWDVYILNGRYVSEEDFYRGVNPNSEELAVGGTD